MATGYSLPVEDGRITTLSDFARKCAEAYFIQMRDSCGPLPDAFEPNPYYAKELAEAKAELAEVESWDTARIAEEHRSATAEDLQRIQQYAANRKAESDRIVAMHEKVEAWEVTGPFLSRLKTFMLSQLDQDLEPRTVRAYEPETVPEIWYSAELAARRARVRYFESQVAEDLSRVAADNARLAELRRGLANADSQLGLPEHRTQP